jgi:hypothetical protein
MLDGRVDLESLAGMTARLRVPSLPLQHLGEIELGVRPHRLVAAALIPADRLAQRGVRRIEPPLLRVRAGQHPQGTGLHLRVGEPPAGDERGVGGGQLVVPFAYGTDEQRTAWRALVGRCGWRG